jgi:general nucleoside transport system ATP-binding protein
MALELRNIHKHFGSVRANNGITMSVEAGTLHGLLGENGAGKSTLMKVLSGFHEADVGEVILDGELLDLSSPRTAMAAGIGMLHQDPLVFLPFSVIDNFVLGSDNIDRAAAADELKTLADRFGFSFDPQAPTRTLTVGERQQLEILRLLRLGAKVLILDEPTTGISTEQRLKLFATLRTLAEDGLIVIFVSHKLEEVDALCTEVTVMRRGTVVGGTQLPVASERLVEMMFGKIVAFSDRDEVAMGESSALRLQNLSASDRLTSIEDLTVDVRAGEVIGLAGLEGSGQQTLLRACAGLLAPTSGSITVGDTQLSGRPYPDFLESGVHFLPAGRLEEGLVQGLTVTEHFVLASGSTDFFVDWDAAEQLADDKVVTNSIRGTTASTAESLSGGNQQRLLLAMMPPELQLLLMEHPTRGLDIESADWVWGQILKRRETGTAIVFASADLDELLRYSDRIIVFFGGRVFKVAQASDLDGDLLGHLIGGRDVG